MRIGLLVGGDSAERKVSLSSGTAIFKALEELGNSVVILDPKDGIHLLKDKIQREELSTNARKHIIKEGYDIKTCLSKQLKLVERVMG